ncbi:MAG TPA: glycosyltransferase [Candidatus Obscuribacterales bacterium]
MASEYRISLFYSDTGGGHRSAVEAINAALNEVISKDFPEHSFHIMSDAAVEKSHPINQFFVDLYNYLLRHRQEWMKYYFWAIQTFKPNDTELGYQMIKKYFFHLMAEMRPSVIVSVHPMTNQYVARALKEENLAGKVKLITVVTDPNGNFWRGWACPDGDLTLVPNSLSKQQLVEWGVPSEKIRIVGMPVHPDFTRPPTLTREDFLGPLGLDPAKLTLCINAGWAGGGNMVDIYRQLDHVERDIQVVFMCGRNEKLYSYAKHLTAGRRWKTAVMPFYEKMSDVMAHVDLMVTKAGGLTTFEALARRLPMAFDTITPPMPQEMGTVDLLVKEKLAHKIEKPQDIIAVLRDFQPVPDRLNARLPSKYSLDRVNAVYDIARTVLGFCDPAFNPSLAQELASRAELVKAPVLERAGTPTPLLEM